MFPGARTFTLEQIHGSTRTIVALANALVGTLAERPASWTDNPAGPPGRLYTAVDDDDEARFIATEISRLLRGELMQPGQVAVLFRTNAQARAVAFALRTRGIPVRLRAEVDLFACAEVRDLIAYLRLAHSPTDAPALGRILNKPPRRLRAVEHALRKQPVPAADLPDWAHRRAGVAARISAIQSAKAKAGGSASRPTVSYPLSRPKHAGILAADVRRAAADGRAWPTPPSRWLQLSAS